MGTLGIEPSQPNGNCFTDSPASLAEYGPMELLPGLEPGPSDYETEVLPLKLEQRWRVPGDLNPDLTG